MNLNPSSRRAVRGVLNLVAVGGVALAVSPALQSAYGWWSQRQLRAEFEASPRLAAQPSAKTAAQQSSQTPSRSQRPARDTALPRAGSGAAAVTLRSQGAGLRRAERPWPSTRLRIEEIGVDAIVVQGLDEKALARGPGHDPNSVAPGEPGNCVLAAHRNMYGSWFYKLDQVSPGSIIELSARGQTWRYSVIGIQTVAESDSSVLRSPPNSPPILTLITCTLPHSPFRIVATAYLLGE